MTRAILFWFYKQPKLCENRLKLLRLLNPGVKIYGLYGGDPVEQSKYREATAAYLDDFFCFDEPKDGYWKWRNGDILIAKWYKMRGRHLAWDSIVVVQWDMLVLAPIKDLFGSVPENHALLSGYEPIPQESTWPWIKPGARREAYEKFFRYMETAFSFKGPPHRCLFVVVVLPRRFLEKYSSINQAEPGFIEYRVPAYAHVFRTPVWKDHPFRASWQESNPLRRTISPTTRPIPHSLILYHLLRPNGARVFHPFHGTFEMHDVSLGAFAMALLNELPRLVNEVWIRVTRQ